MIKSIPQVVVEILYTAQNSHYEEKRKMQYSTLRNLGLFFQIKNDKMHKWF